MSGGRRVVAEPPRALLAGVLLRACQDARGRLPRVRAKDRPRVTSEARRWLRVTGADLCRDWLDIPAATVREFVDDLP